MKKISPPTAINVAPRIATRVSLSTPKPCAAQRPNTNAKSTTPVSDDDRCQQQPVLEPEPRAQPIERFVLVADEVGAVRPSAQTEADRLDAEEDQEAAQDQGVDVEAAPKYRYLHEHEQRDERAGAEHDGAREHEEEGRVVDEDDAQVSPAVAKRRELRRADSRMELDRYLSARRAPPESPG